MQRKNNSSVFQQKLREAYLRGFRAGKSSRLRESEDSKSLAYVNSVGKMLVTELKQQLFNVEVPETCKGTTFGVRNYFEATDSDPGFTIIVGPTRRSEDTVGVGGTVYLEIEPTTGKLQITADLDCGSATRVDDYEAEGFSSVVDFVVEDIENWYEECEEW